MQVKGLSSETAYAIVAGRPYGSLAEFLEKVPASRDEVETLIRCGAMSSFGRTRPELLWELRMLRPAAGCGVGDGARPKATQQGAGGRDLRAGSADARDLIRRLPRIFEYDLPRRIALELETLDLAVSGHPLEMFGPGVGEALDASADGRNGDASAGERRFVRSIDLPRRVGEEVDIVGWKVTWKSTRTQATMKEMIFVTFSDQWGRFEATFFPEAYRSAARSLVRGPGPFLIRGRVESELGVESLVAERVSMIGEGQDAVCARE
jgi:error-prone DNA polymerase